MKWSIAVTRSLPARRWRYVAAALLAALLVASGPGRISAQESASEYFAVAVAIAEQDYEPGHSPVRPPVGYHWILLSVSLQNNTDQIITVGRDSLTLIDQQGGRHAPTDPSFPVQVQLVGSDVTSLESQMGSVLFEVPEEALGVELEWCPRGPADCEQPLRSPLPQAP